MDTFFEKIMDEKKTLFELKPNKLAEILNVCSEGQNNAENIPESQQKAELLQDRLSETLMSGSLKKSSLRKELVDLCTMAGIASTESIRNLLTNPNTDKELIDKIKRHGKRLSQTNSSQVEHETANVIYYAAIASALVFHHEKITQFSYKNLEEAFTVFIETEWISKDLQGLFEKATVYCRGKINNE